MGGRWRPGSNGPGQPGPAPSSAAGWDAYGRGHRDPITGLYEWYDVPETERPPEGPQLTWHDLTRYPRWLLVEADLQDCGVDIDDRALMRSRTWRWLQVRIVGLLYKPETRIARMLAESQPEQAL